MGDADSAVYYWVGEAERGRWRAVTCKAGEVDAVLRAVAQMGYVAATTHPSYGPPRCRPTPDELREAAGQLAPVTSR